MTRRVWWALVALATISACSPGGSSAPPAPPDTSPFHWQPFGDTGRVQTGSLEVPMDPDDPSKGVIDLHLARHLADPDQRIGSLLVNPGGPGFGGSDYALFADSVYSDVLLDRFDIVGWDPRGTGLSEPTIDCTSDSDHFHTGLDITPDTATERQLPIDLAEEFAADCVAKNAAVMPYVGTEASARDIDLIRRALGEATISYFGFSYGSELGATWATLFPDTVRAAVFDGAADPTADFVEAGVQQSAGFEHAIETFLARCSADSDCAFHSDGDAESAFDALMASLDEHPIRTVNGRADLTRGMALNAVAQAMYRAALWPELEDGLAAAEGGDGEGLLALFDRYYQRQPDGTHDNALEAFQVIECQDNHERLTVEEDDATAPLYHAVAPRFAPSTIGSYFCTFFPPSTSTVVRITGIGAGPILVMGTTGDPATPLPGTATMAGELEDGRLVVVTGEGHTGYGLNECSREVVDQYLVDPVNHAPVDGTTCP